MDVNFIVIFEKDGPWWIGSVPELPGANTHGATLDGARENMNEAIAMVLDANRQLASQKS